MLHYSFRSRTEKKKKERLTDRFFIMPRAPGLRRRRFFLVRPLAVKRILCKKPNTTKSQVSRLFSCSSQKQQKKNQLHAHGEAAYVPRAASSLTSSSCTWMTSSSRCTAVNRRYFQHYSKAQESNSLHSAQTRIPRQLLLVTNNFFRFFLSNIYLLISCGGTSKRAKMDEQEGVP